MCESREQAAEICFRFYGHRDVAKTDYQQDGHYYNARDALEWVVTPDEHSHGTLGIAKGGQPLCVIEKASIKPERGMSPLFVHFDDFAYLPDDKPHG